MNDEIKNLLVETLRNNLSSDFKRWCSFEEKRVPEIKECPDRGLLFLSRIIMRPLKTQGRIVTDTFINDAEFVCQYALKLNFDDEINNRFHLLLAEIYLEKRQYQNCLSEINIAKLYLLMKEDWWDLEEVSILEWNVYKEQANGFKMLEIQKDIEHYKNKQNSINEDKELSNDNNSLIFSLEANPTNKIFKALQKLNIETRPLIKKSPIEELQQFFEFDLFAFSFYLLHLNDFRTAKVNELEKQIISFYSIIVSDIARQDPMTNSFFNFLIKDKQIYIQDKINSYKHEINKIIENKNYVSKYTYASFFMYPLHDDTSITEGSSQINEKNIIEFHVELLGVIELMATIAKKFKNYINI